MGRPKKDRRTKRVVSRTRPPLGRIVCKGAPLRPQQVGEAIGVMLESFERMGRPLRLPRSARLPNRVRREDLVALLWKLRELKETMTTQKRHGRP